MATVHIYAIFKLGYARLRRTPLHSCARRQPSTRPKRGVRNAPPPPKTFGDLCDYWVEKRTPRKRSRKDDASIIGKHLRPAFGVMKVRDVGVEEVDGYINEKIDIDELSDKTGSDHVTLLATILCRRASVLSAVPSRRSHERARKYDAKAGSRGGDPR
jgi:hypothetical protein